MKKTSYVILISIFATFAFTACNNQATKNNNEIKRITAEDEQKLISSPPVIIYKTKANYDTLVPILISAEGDRIVSYPDIRDLTYKGELAYPTKLSNGFLLDNRGITEKVVFLNISYAQYKKLEKTPTRDEIKEMILDKDPLEAMYFCGSRGMYKDIVKELNEKIEADNFSMWSKLK